MQASAEKPGVLNLFLSHFFFMLSSKRGFSSSAFSTQPFKTWVLTRPDFENPKKKVYFNPENGHFWFTLNRPPSHNIPLLTLNVQAGTCSLTRVAVLHSNIYWAQIRHFICRAATAGKAPKSGPCLDFWFQYALISNNRPKNIEVEYRALPGSNSQWRPWANGFL